MSQNNQLPVQIWTNCQFKIWTNGDSNLNQRWFKFEPELDSSATPQNHEIRPSELNFELNGSVNVFSTDFPFKKSHWQCTIHNGTLRVSCWNSFARSSQVKYTCIRNNGKSRMQHFKWKVSWNYVTFLKGNGPKKGGGLYLVGYFVSLKRL